MSDDLHSRMGAVETHIEYTKDRLDSIESKLDTLHVLLTKRSPWAVVATAVAAFVASNWKTLTAVLLALVGAGWAAPILAALK
jgi:hypothetical protein